MRMSHSPTSPADSLEDLDTELNADKQVSTTHGDGSSITEAQTGVKRMEADVDKKGVMDGVCWVS
jgi:hypothetical protein